MEIKRIGSDRSVNTETDRVVLKHNSITYTITPHFNDGLKISKDDDGSASRFLIMPACSNEIIIE